MKKSKVKMTIQNSKLTYIKSIAKRYPNFDFCILHFEFKKGFTLLEMLISLSIFSVIIMMAAGIMISVQNAREKVGTVLLMQDNIRFTLELFSREIRTGAVYQTTTKGRTACGAARVPLNSELSFTHWNQGFPQPRTYFLYDTDNNGAPDTIMRVKQGSFSASDCSNPSIVTPFTDTDNMAVERLRFDLFGQTPGASDGQPWVRIILRARSRGVKTQLQSVLNIQTTMSQRLRDL